MPGNKGTFLDSFDGEYLRFDPKYRCTGKARQNGRKRCRRQVVRGKRVCYWHGGMSPGRPPTNGRYTRVPGALREAYKASLADSTLADLREPLAILDAIAKRAMDRVEDKDTPELRKRALELLEEVQAALGAGDAELGAQKLQALHALLRRGAEESEALTNLSDAVEAFSRRAEAYWGVKLSRRQSMNAGDLIAILRAFVTIVKSEAPSDVSARIVERIEHDVYRGSFGLRLLSGEGAEPTKTIEAETPRKPGAAGA